MPRTHDRKEHTVVQNTHMLRTTIAFALVAAARAEKALMVVETPEATASTSLMQSAISGGFAGLTYVVTDVIAAQTATGYAIHVASTSDLTVSDLVMHMSTCEFRTVLETMWVAAPYELTSPTITGVCVADDTATTCPADAVALTNCAGGDDGGSDDTTPEPSSGDDGGGDDSGLSGGAIAGIVVGVIVGMAVIIFVILFFFTNIFAGIGGGGAAWVFAGTATPVQAAQMVQHATLPFVHVSK